MKGKGELYTLVLASADMRQEKGMHQFGCIPFLNVFKKNLRKDYLTYSAKLVRRMSPLRRKVSCIAKAALRQW